MTTMRPFRRLSAISALLALVGLGGDDWAVKMQARVVGESINSQFGHAIAVGDIDADGWPEVAVGAPGAAGSAGMVLILDGQTLKVRLTLRGEKSGDQFGFALAMTDWDLDGSPDLVIGAPGWRERRGLVGLATQLRKDRSEWIVLLSGSQPGDQLGWAVAPAPGKNGSPDLVGVVVGAPGSDSGAAKDTGSAMALVKGNRKKPVQLLYSVKGMDRCVGLGRFVGLREGFLKDRHYDLLIGSESVRQDAATGLVESVAQTLVVDGKSGAIRFDIRGVTEEDRCSPSAAAVKLHGEGVQYSELLVAYSQGVFVYSGNDGVLLQTLQVSEDRGQTRVASLGRIDTEYLYGFVVAHTPSREDTEFTTLTFYSSEDLSVIGRIRRPASSLSGASMTSWRRTGVGSAQLIVGSPGSEEATGSFEMFSVSRDDD